MSEFILFYVGGMLSSAFWLYSLKQGHCDLLDIADTILGVAFWPISMVVWIVRGL